MKRIMQLPLAAVLVATAGAAAATEVNDPVVAEWLAPVQETTLDEVRGQGDGGFLQLNDTDLQATMTGNVIHSSTTGSNSISNGAFTNMEGFATVIQNTGNHVILQNSTIINFMLNQ